MTAKILLFTHIIAKLNCIEYTVSKASVWQQLREGTCMQQRAKLEALLSLEGEGLGKRIVIVHNAACEGSS